jgi:hypothetical protein
LTETDNDRLVAAFLHEGDATCPSCGYNLRNLTKARCPECDWRLELTLRVVQRSLAAWIAMITVLALNAGFGLLVIYITLSRGWPAYEGKRYQIYYAAYLYQMLTVPMLVAVILGRRFLLRASLTRQWIDVALITTVSIAAFVTLTRM